MRQRNPKSMIPGVLLALFLLSSTAWANPISTEIAKAYQYPGTPHAQLSFFLMEGFGEEGQDLAPTSLKRGGVLLPFKPVGPTGISLNGGSGIGVYQAYQFCDCDLQAGEYRYAFVFPEGSSIEEYEDNYYKTLEIEDPPPSWEDLNPESDPIATDGDYDAPWLIDDGQWPKGLDCSTWCDEDHSDLQLDGSGDVGCSTTASSAALLLILLFALICGRRMIKARTESRK